MSEITCLEPTADGQYSYTAPNDVADQCDGFLDPGISLSQVRYEPFTERRTDPHTILVLIDQSGSTSVSCLTGGHYQFVNSETMPKVNTAGFEGALKQALRNVRYSLMGYWQFAHVMPVLGANLPTPIGGTPPGSLYSFSGALTIHEEMNLVPESFSSRTKVYPYGVGLGDGAESAQNWDRRPTIAKPCTAAADCVFLGGTPGEASSCQIVCSPETHLCPGAAEGVTARDGAQCTPADGGVGACCEGSCLTMANVCPACDEP